MWTFIICLLTFILFWLNVAVTDRVPGGQSCDQFNHQWEVMSWGYYDKDKGETCPRNSSIIFDNMCSIPIVTMISMPRYQNSLSDRYGLTNHRGSMTPMRRGHAEKICSVGPFFTSLLDARAPFLHKISRCKNCKKETKWNDKWPKLIYANKNFV